MSSPIKIGLTGSIGMGKSTTAEMFRAEGIPVWSADNAVHELYLPKGEGTAAIAELCPAAVSENGVDRKILSAWIQESPQRLSDVEKKIHPLVARHRQTFIDTAREPAAVLDVPLLFETGADKSVDYVVVVTTSEEEQRRRVLERPGMSAAKLEMILEKQMPDAEKQEKADYIIETSSLAGARDQVRNVLKDLGLEIRNA